MALKGKANGCWAQHVPELHRKKVMAAILADMDRNPNMDEVEAAKLSAKYFIDKYTKARERLMELVVAEYDKDFSSGVATPPPDVSQTVAERVVPEEATTRAEELAAKEKEAILKTATQVAKEEQAATKTEKPKAKRAPKPKDPEVRNGETTAEAAGREWNARRPAGFPAWEELPQAARTEFASYGPPGWEQADIITTAAKFSRGGAKRSQESTAREAASQRSFAAALSKELAEFIGLGTLDGSGVTVVQQLSQVPPEAIAATEAESGTVDARTQAIFHRGKVWMIADNIAKGNGRAVFMHEAGAHMGVESIISPEELQRLTSQIRAWAAEGYSTREGRIANAALGRVAAAGTTADQVDSETLAYFLEEAIKHGVDPVASRESTRLGRWFAKLWKAFKEAMAKVKVKPSKLTAQDLVDFAYGAARMQMTGKGGMVPGGAMRSFVGTLAKMDPRQADRLNANRLAAWLLDSQGVSLEQIWKETGWMRGGDNHWRREIDDSKASLKVNHKDPNGDLARRLKDVLRHDALFRAYPELADLWVTFDRDSPDSQYSRLYDTVTVGASGTRAEALASLLHEVQHVIQFEENFSAGSSPQFMPVSDIDAVKRVAARMKLPIGSPGSETRASLERELSPAEAGRIKFSLWRLAEASPKDMKELEAAERAYFKRMMKKLQTPNHEELADTHPVVAALSMSADKLREVFARVAKVDPTAPVDDVLYGVQFALYHSIAGEIEARDTQERVGLSSRERRGILPALGGSKDTALDGGKLWDKYQDRYIVKNTSAKRSLADENFTEQFMGKSIYDSGYRKGRLTEKDVLQVQPAFRQQMARDWIKYNDNGDFLGFFKKYPGTDTMSVKNVLGGHFVEGLHKDEYAKKQARLNEIVAARKAEKEEAENKVVRERSWEEEARNTKTIIQQAAEPYAKHLGMSVEDMYAAYRAGDRAKLKALYDRVGVLVQRLDSLGSAKRSVASAAVDLLPQPLQRPARVTTTNLRTMAKQGVLMGAITQDLADMAAKVFSPDDPSKSSVHAYMKAQIERQATRLEHELRIENILRAFEKLPKEETGTGPKSVNAFIYDSTFDGKWGYTPANIPFAVVDPELKERFEKFSPAAQEVIRATFEHGRQTMLLKQEAVRNQINSEFAAAIAEATDEAEIAKLERKRNIRLAHYESMLGVDASQPYAPLKRYGEYVVVGKSLAYLDAEKNSDAAELAKLERDENHYIVEFFDTQGEADAREQDLFGRYADLSSGPRENAEALNAGNRDMFLAFDRMRKAIDNELSETKVGTESLRKMKSMLRDMYLLSLSEASARKSELRRRNIHGASTDMMRALATQGRADAHFISTVKHDGEVQDSIQSMRAEVKKNRREAVPYLNELLIRHADSMQNAPHRVEDAIRRATSIWMLATSPAFYFQQMTQTYMMSVPVIATRFGYGTAMKAVTDAYFDAIFPLVGGNLDRLDFSKAPADVQDMLKELTRQGKIDIGIDVEMGEAAMSSRGHVARAWNTVDRTLRNLNVKVESINRAAAAVAAYRLALAKNGGNKAEAIEYAGKVVHISHGSYDGFNTPRLLSSAFPGARTVTQFRRFQIIQISMLARMWNDAMKGQDADTRRAGRAGLKYVLAHAFAVGGLMGLPGFTAIAWLVGKLWPDDDEPDNPELTLRRLLGDGPMTDMLVRGVPKMAGIDLSGKLGMGQTFSLMPFANLDSRTMSRQGYAETLAAAMGPFFGGLMPRAIDGVGQVMSGDLYKGMEQLLPSGLANAFKAARFASEGVTMRKGDVVMPPEEVAFVDAVFQGLGLPTNTITDRQFVASAKRTYDDYYKATESGLLRKYAVAYRSGDMAALEEAREEWHRLQESRVRNGYSRQPLSTLLKAPQEMAKRERQTEGGVAYAKGTKRFVEDTAALVR